MDITPINPKSNHWMYEEINTDEVIIMLQRSIEEINKLKHRYKDVGHAGKYINDCNQLINKLKSEHSICDIIGHNADIIMSGYCGNCKGTEHKQK